MFGIGKQNLTLKFQRVIRKEVINHFRVIQISIFGIGREILTANSKESNCLKENFMEKKNIVLCRKL